MFYDASVIDGEGEDEGTQALRATEERSSEAVCFLVDARHRMFQQTLSDGASCAHHALASLSLYLQSRIIASPNDRAAVILYGTREKRNDYNLDHVYVLHELQPLTARLLRNLSPSHGDENDGGGGGDDGKDGPLVGQLRALSYPGSESHRGLSLKHALWQSSHVLSEATKNRAAKVDKRIFIFTNDDDPCEGQDLLRTQTLGRLADLRALQVDFHLYPLGNPAGEGGSATFRPSFWSHALREANTWKEDEGERFLEEMQLQLADSGVDGASQKRKINRKRRWAATRLKIEAGRNASPLEIEVEYYLMRGQQKVAARYVDAETNALLETSTAYVCSTSGGVVEDQPTKGWSVRGERVLARALEYELIKDVGHLMGFHLLGFKPARCLKPFYQIKPSAFLYPNEKDHPGSCRLFLAFHEQMRAGGQVAICSYAATRGTASGADLVALVPQQEARDSFGNQVEPPGMWVIFLPYADDMRYPELLFRTKKDHVSKASSDQVDKALALVRALQLPEDFECDQVPNPSLQRHYEVLQAVALGEDPTQCTVTDETLPNQALFKGPAQQAALVDFEAAFNFNAKKRKKSAKKTTAPSSKKK
mmetsp:Transcript_33489/g.72324  ORF Transcript_33489/g.72324 Transcript_33489/m.72324 type:complete len:594 (-) Transcript_33489:1080-2861(-)